jgi:hypothetical protein
LLPLRLRPRVSRKRRRDDQLDELILKIRDRLLEARQEVLVIEVKDKVEDENR